MKFIVALCLFGVALSVPQGQNAPRIIEILRNEVSPIEGANFRYAYETENGITAEKQGVEGSEGQSNMAGSFSFPLDDGSLAQFSYTADENGYNVQSPLLPVAPPMPEHALEQIRFAEEQRARGVEWDDQGFVI